MQDGRLLTQLLRASVAQRSAYLEWAAASGHPEEEAVPHYRRALIACYENWLRSGETTDGPILPRLIATAGHYFGGPAPPGLPRPVALSAEGDELFRRFRRLAEPVRELLLLADYHRLSPAALARAHATDDAESLLIEVREGRVELVALFPDRPDLYQDVLTVAGRQDLYATLLRQEQEIDTTPTRERLPNDDVELAPLRPRRRFAPPRPGVVFAAILFGVLLWLVYDTFGRPAPDRLAERYFSPYPNIVAATEPATDYEADLQRILQDYDRGDYRTTYDALLPAAGVYPASYLYLGVSALALDDPKRALDWLNRIPREDAYYSAAEWYRALAMLDVGADAGAGLLLNAIAERTGHPYRSQARELLADL